MLSLVVKNNTYVHSYLFVGKDGIGKSLFATEFAKMLLCQGQQRPCNRCKSCVEFEAKSHPDFLIIKPEEEKSIKIEQIRYLQEKIAEKPVTSLKKIYVIENSETMTREAANSLLKTLEEPPEYAVIILLTSNESKLLTTIKSRCMKINFAPLQEEQIEDYLKQNDKAANITPSMLKNSEGSIGKALKIEEEKEQDWQRETLMKNIKDKNITQIWKEAELLYQAKENIISLLDYITIMLYDNLQKQNKICYAKAIQIVEKAKKRILANANYDMSIDFLLLKLWEELA